MELLGKLLEPMVLLMVFALGISIGMYMVTQISDWIDKNRRR